MAMLGAAWTAPGTADAAKRAPALAPAQTLVSHRVVYKMRLMSSRRESGVSAAEGVMLYRFAETCDAWTAETNVFLKLRYAEGPAVNNTWSFAAFESKDGLRYRFRLRHLNDGEPTESLKGSASLDSLGGPGRATFRGAAEGGGDETMALPEGTMFPTFHLARVMQAASGGERFLAETIFDGASLKNPYRISATIGAQRPPGAAAGLRAALQAAGLDAGPVWPVRLAFFPTKRRSPEPEFEIGVDYRADGIAERVEQDYGGFVIEMTPAEVEVLARPEC